ncbi:MAG: nitrogenase cofactor biosynthesis protein NifB [Fibrobacterota bacterium]|nr:nitrogenase cofactor biosynthesis protein NifB [Chitinispirillaceae bacterium]
MIQLPYSTGKENTLTKWESGAHPCFNAHARERFARIHLPVAPKCNIQCKFCNRKFSCVNESRPGVTARLLSPREALDHLDKCIQSTPAISVVGIAGPGDPFANPLETMETLRLVRKKYPGMLLCVSSNGLNILPFVDELRALKVSHATITVNAVDPIIGSLIYEWITVNNQQQQGYDAVYTLWDYQQLAIQALSFRGITVKVNTVLIPGINDSHIEVIAKTVADLGASLHNVIPLIPAKETAFESIPSPSATLIKNVRTVAKRYLPQMEHCNRCRADAVGMLTNTESRPLEFIAQSQQNTLTHDPKVSIPVTSRKTRIAVASQEGLFINLHLGQAESLRIYDIKNSKPVLVDIRKTAHANAGCGKKNWHELAHLIRDCYLLLVSGAGPLPIDILDTKGIKVKIIEDEITTVLSQIITANTAQCDKLYFQSATI